MKLAWEREGVIRVTAKAAELAALVAGARLASAAMAADDGEQASELRRVLEQFDRATQALHARTPAVTHRAARTRQEAV